jgi:nucleotide-binding universal stress UspA family protein
MSGAVPSTVSVSPSTQEAIQSAAPVALARILVAVDASDHANWAVAEATRLAASAGGTVTGIHAYAAKLHDRRFRQMEGGLPERYREENELERQRKVHDSLITRGLGIIGDSYHDAAEQACIAAAVPYRRLSPEGKNYRRIVEAAESGAYDVLILGALGLAAGDGDLIGSVCGRVTRRSSIDVLVIRGHRRALGEGPLVVGIDGSPQSYGALRTGIDLGRRLGAPVHAVATFDPYFHYVAFRRIAGVLSEEAGRVFRFKEQEKLHEEIIDDGLAKIYASHLEVARAVAQADGAEIVTALLDGKPYRAIARYLGEVGASLLLVGKTGIHADAELDIGGNTENLLRLAPCHVWIGTATHTPPLDAVARETIVWSAEAEQRMARVPETVRDMVRMVIMRSAQEQGHTIITSALIDQATARFCPGHAKADDDALPWSEGAKALLTSRADAPADVQLRAEKHARRGGATEVLPEHVAPFLTAAAADVRMSWSAAALARLARVPPMGRGAVRARAEACAHNAGEDEVTPAIVEQALAESRQAMAAALQAGGHKPRPPQGE